MNTRRWLQLALAFLLATGCSSSSNLHVYNDTGQDVTLTVGSQTLTMSVEEPHKTFEVPLKAGTKIMATGSKGAKDEVVLTSTDLGRDVIYNVSGTCPLYLVDYAGCYTKEGERMAETPFKVAADLSGRKVAAAPAGVLVDAYAPFPSEVLGDAHVYRLEVVPPSLATHGVDAYVAQLLSTEVKMRGHLYRK